jgi:hypothetical protein
MSRIGDGSLRIVNAAHERCNGRSRFRGLGCVLTVAGYQRAIDIGVYPLVGPLRPTVGSLMEHLAAPSPEYCETIYRRVVPYLSARGLGAWAAVRRT